MAKDPEQLAHLEWLGYVQPVGLVVSIPALLAAQAHVNRNIAPDHQQFLACLPRDRSDDIIPEIRDFPRFTQTVLHWEAEDLQALPQAATLPEPFASLEVALPEYQETLRPTYAVRELEPKNNFRPWLMLIQEVPAGADLDEPTAATDRNWHASPHAKFERLLRETEVPIGLLTNRTHLRLIYAPRGETSGYMTFSVAEMAQVAGRPMFAGLHMLLCAERLFALPEKQRLPAILAESRKYQNTVSTQLAEQVLAALFELLRGFQAADDQRRGELLRQVLADDPNHVYAGLLTVLMRLVFILYAEDRGMMPADPVYSNFYSVTGLFERLRADAGRYPDTMDLRYGAWAQLLTLFRLIYDGGRHGAMRIPARKGYLFDPDRYPFLEGRPRGSRYSDSPKPEIPHVSDGVVFRVLNNLLILDGERLSYRTLDVEQIGSVYEAIMGFNLEVAQGRSIAIKPAKPHGAPATINLEALLAQPPKDRLKWLKDHTDQTLSGQAAEALKAAQTIDDLLAALDRKIARNVTPNEVQAGAMVFQPSDERRRSGSHYTPRSLTEPIVRTTLRPVLERLGGGSRELGMGSRESAVGSRDYGQDRVVSGPPGVASGHATGQGLLPAYQAVSARGDVRADEPDPARGSVHPGQHRGGERPGEYGRLHPVPAHGAREPEGGGDALAPVSGSGDYAGQADRSAFGASRPTRQDASVADPQPSAQAKRLAPDSPLPTPHSHSPTPEQILSLKICDPAMGSGAFLVEACRQLGDELVKAWHVHNQVPKLPPDEDEVLHARHLVAQQCLYGVDKNPLAVDLAKLSLWLATLAKDHPFTFLDHSLRCGDSLVGLAQKQIAAFTWEDVGGGESGVESSGQRRKRSDSRLPTRDSLLFADPIAERMKTVTEYRQRILAARDEKPYDQLRQELEVADEALGHARLAGDCVIAAYFSAHKDKDRKNRLDQLARQLVKYLGPEARIEDRRPLAEAVAELRSGEHPIQPFHWEIEFPEVFSGASPGFDAIVGNPPFAGKNTLIGSHREGYLDWLKSIHAESHGNSDLVAHFFRRAFNLLRPPLSCIGGVGVAGEGESRAAASSLPSPSGRGVGGEGGSDALGGCFGLIATNTIGQGDTRSTGLRWICTHGGTIYAARKRLKWPGQAAVVVSVVHVCRGPHPGPYLLDGRQVPIITAYLFHAGTHDDPEKLKANEGKSFQGSIVLGMGFTFDDTDKSGVANPISLMHELVAKDPRNAERIFPYIGGEEVNDSPTHAHHRYVINFEERPEAECRQNWPELMAIIEAKVKPERLAQNDRGAKEKWWQFIRPRPELHDAIHGLDRVLVTPQTSNVQGFAFIPAAQVFAHTLVIFSLPSFSAFAVLQSRAHQRWAAFFGPTMKDDLRYTPSDCFETFPFPPGVLEHAAADPRFPTPDCLLPVETAGREYYEFRAALMVRNNEGLTKTYNRFHDPSETSPDIQKLRELHAAMDRAVLEAYGWHDLAESARCEFLLDYEEENDEEGSGEWGVGSRGADEAIPTPDSRLPTPSSRRRRRPWRYRWPDELRDEVMARLLELNKQRAQAERLAGLTAEGGAGRSKAVAKRASRGRRKTKANPAGPEPPSLPGMG